MCRRTCTTPAQRILKPWFWRRSLDTFCHCWQKVFRRWRDKRCGAKGVRIATGAARPRNDTLHMKCGVRRSAKTGRHRRGCLPEKSTSLYASMPRLVRYFFTIKATLKVMASSNSRRSKPVSFLIFSRRYTSVLRCTKSLRAVSDTLRLFSKNL